MKHRPWERSTGPRTPEGKARSSQNGRYRQTGEMSQRQVQRELGDIGQLLAGLAESRRLVFNEE